MDVTAVSEEMEQARRAFRELVGGVTAAGLRRRSAGTRWTNRQLLFHMVFGYLVVLTLRPLVRGFGRLSITYSRRFSAASTRCASRTTQSTTWARASAAPC